MPYGNAIRFFEHSVYKQAFDFPHCCKSQEICFRNNDKTFGLLGVYTHGHIDLYRAFTIHSTGTLWQPFEEINIEKGVSYNNGAVLKY